MVSAGSGPSKQKSASGHLEAKIFCEFDVAVSVYIERVNGEIVLACLVSRLPIGQETGHLDRTSWFTRQLVDRMTACPEKSRESCFDAAESCH